MLTGRFAFPRLRRVVAATPMQDLSPSVPVAAAPAGFQTDLDDVFDGLATERRLPRWWQMAEALCPGARRQG